MNVEEVKILDVNGRIVRILNPCTYGFNVSVDDLPGSIYYFQLRTEGGQIVKGQLIIL